LYRILVYILVVICATSRVELTTGDAITSSVKVGAKIGSPIVTPPVLSVVDVITFM
jgi:hypothetical protein